MKAQLKSTLDGPGQYMYTQPAALEVNVFAGKKRAREEEPLDSDEEEQRYLARIQGKKRQRTEPER